MPTWMYGIQVGYAVRTIVIPWRYAQRTLLGMAFIFVGCKPICMNVRRTYSALQQVGLHQHPLDAAVACPFHILPQPVFAQHMLGDFDDYIVGIQLIHVILVALQSLKA